MEVWGSPVVVLLVCLATGIGMAGRNLQKSRHILNVVGHRRSPLFIVGDFNMTAEEVAHSELGHGLGRRSMHLMEFNGPT